MTFLNSSDRVSLLTDSYDQNPSPKQEQHNPKFLSNQSLAKILGQERVSQRQELNSMRPSESQYNRFFNISMLAGGIIGGVVGTLSIAYSFPAITAVAFCSAFGVIGQLPEGEATRITWVTMAMAGIGAIIRKSASSQFNLIASAISDLNCSSECFKSDSCKDSVKSERCITCVSDCEQPIYKSPLVATPLALLTAGFIGRSIVYISGSIAKWKKQNTINKINNLIKNLQIFKLMPTQVSDIENLKLSPKTRKEILFGMNATQLVELKGKLSDKQFKSFSERILDKDTQSTISALSNINNDESTAATIIQLKSEMQSDVSIWEEIVKRLSNENFNKVGDLLRNIGVDLKIENVDLAIVCLRAKHSKEVSFQVRVNGEKRSKVPVKVGHILKYDSFRSLSNELLVEDTEQIFNLDLSDIESYGFPVLIKLLETGEVNIDKYLAKDPKLALSLYALTSRFEIEDYSIICHEYLLREQSKLNENALIDLIDYLLTFTSNDFLSEKNEQFISIKFKQACHLRDYKLINSIFNSISRNNKEHIIFNIPEIRDLLTNDPNALRILFEYDFPLTQAMMKTYLLNQITPLYNIDILTRYPNIRSLSTEIENTYIRELNEGIYKELWDYSIENNRENLKSSCLRFFEDQNSNTANRIIRKWPAGKLPKEIARLLINGLEGLGAEL